MFNSISSLRSRRLSVVCVALIGAFVLSVSSCKSSDDIAEKSLTGTWTSSYADYYKIDNSTVTYYDGGYGYDWTASLEGVSATDDASGYVYIKYTKVGSGLDSTLVGAYVAVSYTSLSDSAAKFATAYKVGGKTTVSTLDEAKTEFTVDNGYFTTYGSYAKSE